MNESLVDHPSHTLQENQQIFVLMCISGTLQPPPRSHHLPPLPLILLPKRLTPGPKSTLIGIGSDRERAEGPEQLFVISLERAEESAEIWDEGLFDGFFRADDVVEVQEDVDGLGAAVHLLEFW